MVFDILGYILVKSFWTYLCKANIGPFANDIFHYVFLITFFCISIIYTIKLESESCVHTNIYVHI